MLKLKSEVVAPKEEVPPKENNIMIASRCRTEKEGKNQDNKQDLLQLAAQKETLRREIQELETVLGRIRQEIEASKAELNKANHSPGKDHSGKREVPTRR